MHWVGKTCTLEIDAELNNILATAQKHRVFLSLFPILDVKQKNKEIREQEPMIRGKA
jgi:hypothetical protein